MYKAQMSRKADAFSPHLFHSGRKYNSSAVYGANANYVNKFKNENSILPPKFSSNLTPGTVARKQSVSSSYHFSSERNKPVSTYEIKRPTPPTSSYVFKSPSYSYNNGADMVRPSMRDRTSRSPVRPALPASPAVSSKPTSHNYRSASRDHSSPRDPRQLMTNRKSFSTNDVKVSSTSPIPRPHKPSVTVPRSSPLPNGSVSPSVSRNLPVSHATAISREKISIDSPPYRSEYKPSFSRSSSPTRIVQSNRKSYAGPGGDGGTGLKNIGNTCFMNSIIQCLSHTVQLRDYCLKLEYESQVNENSSMRGRLIRAFAEVIKELWSGSAISVTPTSFKTQIQKFSPRFMGYEQQDCQEFLRFLLEGLHEDINKVKKKSSEPLKDLSARPPQEIARETWKWYGQKDESFIFNLFVGQLESCLECSECRHVSLTYDPFWDLSLPISKTSHSSLTTNLTECLRTFTKEETLDRDEKPMCENCKVRKKMKKKLTIHRFPQILVIHLKRFHEGSRYRQKLSNLVQFPVKDLRLEDFSSETCEDKNSTTYDLYAVSNHCGSCYGGHYTAYCAKPGSKIWREFNDSSVSERNENSICTKEAYVLFYVRKLDYGRSSRL